MDDFTPTPNAPTVGDAVRQLCRRTHAMADECGLELCLLLTAIADESRRQQVLDCLRRAADLLRSAGHLVGGEAAEDWRRQWHGIGEP